MTDGSTSALQSDGSWLSPLQPHAPVRASACTPLHGTLPSAAAATSGGRWLVPAHGMRMAQAGQLLPGPSCRASIACLKWLTP